MSQAMEYIGGNRGKGQPLGGSTDAQLHDTPQGRFVSKRGAHPRHIQNEYDMNRYLNALGVTVPDAGMYDDEMLTEYEEGAEPFDADRDMSQITRDFVPHAAIANWDMLGMHDDNVLRRPDGSLSYVDVGGAGPYRAQGAPKGRAFGSTVGELDTLREKNPSSLGNITEQDIGQSYDTYGGQDTMNDALQNLRDAQTRDIMQRRIQDIARRVAQFNTERNLI